VLNVKKAFKRISQTLTEPFVHHMDYSMMRRVVLVVICLTESFSETTERTIAIIVENVQSVNQRVPAKLSN